MSAGHILYTTTTLSQPKKHQPHRRDRSFDHSVASIRHRTSSTTMVLSLLLLSSTTGCHAATSNSHIVVHPMIRTSSTAFVAKKSNLARSIPQQNFETPRYCHSNVASSSLTRLRSSFTAGCRWGTLHDTANNHHRLVRSMSTLNADDLTDSAAHPAGTPYDLLNRERGILDKYDPSTFEKDIYQWWEQSGCFQPDAQNLLRTGPKAGKAERKPYVLPMPPPNVTGRLHMGHAIFVALQDVLARFHRMRGRPVLWLPGTDHAGIATQLQVEKILIAEGTTREQVGRDAFLKRVWDYKKEQGGFITQQLRSLGASADWSRERFTMDAELSEAVVEAFVRLHEKGLIYRGEYMVNWAPMLKTAVSDLEVEYTDELGKLYFFKYMIEGSEGKFEQHIREQAGKTQSSCSLYVQFVPYRVSTGSDDTSGNNLW